MIRLAEPLAWEVDLEPCHVGRQLRLVPDGILPVGGAVTTVAAEAPDVATDTLDVVGEDAFVVAATSADPEAVQTLASYVVRLRPGSECCWCGDTLVQGQVESGPSLVCRSCGALVDSPVSVQSGGVRL
jgi:hypothetical protein